MIGLPSGTRIWLAAGLHVHLIADHDHFDPGAGSAEICNVKTVRSDVIDLRLDLGLAHSLHFCGKRLKSDELVRRTTDINAMAQ